jgi:hypothetical protein
MASPAILISANNLFLARLRQMVRI